MDTTENTKISYLRISNGISIARIIAMLWIFSTNYFSHFFYLFYKVDYQYAIGEAKNFIEERLRQIFKAYLSTKGNLHSHTRTNVNKIIDNVNRSSNDYIKLKIDLTFFDSELYKIKLFNLFQYLLFLNNLSDVGFEQLLLNNGLNIIIDLAKPKKFLNFMLGLSYSKKVILLDALVGKYQAFTYETLKQETYSKEFHQLIIERSLLANCQKKQLASFGFWQNPLLELLSEKFIGYVLAIRISTFEKIEMINQISTVGLTARAIQKLKLCQQGLNERLMQILHEENDLGGMKFCNIS